MSLSNLQNECLDRVRDYVAQANKKWPRLNMPEPRVLFNLTGTTAGKATYTQNVLELHNGYLLKDTEDYLKSTVGHEVAHLVARLSRVRIKPHGDEWTRVMWMFGLPATRCHRYDVPEDPKLKKAKREFETKDGIVRPVNVGQIITFD